VETNKSMVMRDPRSVSATIFPQLDLAGMAERQGEVSYTIAKQQKDKEQKEREDLYNNYIKNIDIKIGGWSDKHGKEILADLDDYQNEWTKVYKTYSRERDIPAPELIKLSRMKSALMSKMDASTELEKLARSWGGTIASDKGEHYDTKSSYDKYMEFMNQPTVKDMIDWTNKNPSPLINKPPVADSEKYYKNYYGASKTTEGIPQEVTIGENKYLISKKVPKISGGDIINQVQKDWDENKLQPDGKSYREHWGSMSNAAKFIYDLIPGQDVQAQKITGDNYKYSKLGWGDSTKKVQFSSNINFQNPYHKITGGKENTQGSGYVFATDPKFNTTQLAENYNFNPIETAEGKKNSETIELVNKGIRNIQVSSVVRAGNNRYVVQAKVQPEGYKDWISATTFVEGNSEIMKKIAADYPEFEYIIQNQKPYTYQGRKNTTTTTIDVSKYGGILRNAK
jgi:hypothetical protein